jgi:hypothetical protein
MGPAITGDMVMLRKALLEIADESIPVARRLDMLIPNGRCRVKKLGKAVITPILLIMHPDRYGVWNGTSEVAMRELGLWPIENDGESIGSRYEKINTMLLQIAQELGTDLWTLDGLWWRVNKPDEMPIPIPVDSGVGDTVEELPRTIEALDQAFGLERHLHDFLLDNWDRTELGKEWALCEEGGDVEGYGSERQTEVGTIDLLAHHKTDPRWLVIELKRGQTSDVTVGQVLRYMGWVGEHLAQPDEKVEGLVIALGHDERLRYALKILPNVKFMRYEVSFRLVEGRA